MPPTNEDMADATSGVVIEADGEGFTPSQTSIESANKPVDFSSSTSSVLDDLAKGLETGTAPEVKPTPAVTPDADDVDDVPDIKTAAGAAKDTISALDDAIRERSESGKVAADKAAADKAAADKEAADKAVATEKSKKTATDEPKDKLADVQLPPHAKPASHSAFQEIKKVAREQITALETRIKELETKIPRPDQKILDPAIEKELAELRDYRKAHDFVNSEDFKKEFVNPLEQNSAAIEAKLRQSGLKDEQVAQIKQIGFEKLDWDKLFANLPQTSKLSLQALLLNREQLADKHSKALETAKTAPVEYSKKVGEAQKQREASEKAEILAAADEVLAKVDWLKPVEVPVTATEEERKAIEDRNAFAVEQKARYDSIVHDRSAYTHGALVAGTLAAYQFRAELQIFKARAEAAEAELSKIKKSSSTARAARSAPATRSAATNTQPSIFKSGEEALDQYRSEAESRRD